MNIALHANVYYYLMIMPLTGLYRGSFQVVRKVESIPKSQLPRKTQMTPRPPELQEHTVAKQSIWYYCMLILIACWQHSFQGASRMVFEPDFKRINSQEIPRRPLEHPQNYIAWPGAISLDIFDICWKIVGTFLVHFGTFLEHFWHFFNNCWKILEIHEKL